MFFKTRLLGRCLYTLINNVLFYCLIKMRSQKCVEMDVEFRVSLYDHIEQKVIDRDVPMAKGNLGNEKKMMGRGSHV